MKGALVSGAAKRGHSLLAGLLRCGHCGRKMHVTHSGSEGQVVRYGCRGAAINHGAASCISIGADTSAGITGKAGRCEEPEEKRGSGP